MNLENFQLAQGRTQTNTTKPVPTPKPATQNNANSGTGTGAGSGSSAKVVVPPQITNPTGETSVLALGMKGINFLLAMIVIAAVVVIVVAGFRMMVARGNEGEITKAKKALFYAIGGLVLALMSFAIVEIIQNVLK